MNPITDPDRPRRRKPERRVVQPYMPEHVLMNWISCTPTFDEGYASLQQWQKENPHLPDPEYDADLASWILEEMVRDYRSNVRTDHVAGSFTQAVIADPTATYAVTLTANNRLMIRHDAVFDPALRDLLDHASRLDVTVTITMNNNEYHFYPRPPEDEHHTRVLPESARTAQTMPINPTA
jgi:hypothetical protein